METYSRSNMDYKAKSLEGRVGMHCCMFVSYVIYGNENQLIGAKNWLKWGSSTSYPSEAYAIVSSNGSHVGYVTDGGNTVWHSPGANSRNGIKAYSFNDFVKWVMPSYVLRRP
jgi:hypothetical protein